jgi:hypothetical protein
MGVNVGGAKPKVLLAALGAAATIMAAARPASGADTTVAPGASLTLSDDLVLQGTDSFLAGAAGGSRCSIDGASHSIKTTPYWTGRIVIASCDASNLGTDVLPGLDVTAGAGATVDVRDTVFETSGQIYVATGDEITFVFRGNTIAASSLVPAVMDSLVMSQPSFYFRGDGGSSQKLFQGNKVLRSWVLVDGGNNWLIGGATPADGNIVVGVRAGFVLRGTQIVMRGNYVNVTGMLAGWNQVGALDATGEDGALVVEHNVIRGGNWLVRSFAGGELRYNLLGDPYVVSFVRVGSDGRALIHHNVMVRNNKLMETYPKVMGVYVGAHGTTPSVEVYNNTLDGAGYCYDLMGRAVEIDEQAFLVSLRSNVFFNMPSDDGPTNTALVGPGETVDFKDDKKGDPGPPRLGYADYNLFSNPRATTIDNYGVSVEGLTERSSPGFALHDVPSGGAKDAQVDPAFTGPLPTVFPFSDDDVLAGTVNVCQILAFYRGLYTPRADSPLIGAGDPADGPNINVGAVGGDDPADLFGRLCSASDSMLATPPTLTTTCTQAIVIGGGSGTGGTTAGNRGFVCVCDTGSGGVAAPSLLLVAGLILYARARRPSRRRLTR